MSTVEFLSRLRSLNVQLWVEDGRLRYSAPRGALTPALLAEMAERKPEIIAFLRRVEAATRPSAPPIKPVSRDENLPLSFGQERLWFLDQLEPGSAFYNNFSALRLVGTLRVPVLERCLNEILRRHEVLRTTFGRQEGEPIPVIAKGLRLSLPVVDLVGMSKPDQEAKVRELAAQEAQRPFDLTEGPLLRVTLLKLDEDEHVVFMTMHHIVSDGWSVGVLVREVGALYEAFSAGEPSPLSDLPVQYADYAYWQQQWLEEGELESELAYWKEQLADVPSGLELPIDRPRPAIQTFRGTTRWFKLSRSLTEKLKALSQHEEATLFMTLLAAFQVLLYRYTGQEDISVGTPIANRHRAEVEALIGFFINTLVVRTDLSGTPTFRELLRRVREVALEAYANQDLPFEMLVDELQLRRDMSRSPLFQVMFVVQNAPMEALELPGLIVTPIEIETETSKFDLTLSLVEEQGRLSGSLEYSTDLFDDGTISRMLGHFRNVLEGIVADADMRISELPLLTYRERQQALVEWNATQAERDVDLCVPRQFEAQVRRTPDAVALVFEGQHVTYRELNRKANQLAHCLNGLGVGLDTPVGIYVERSPEMIVAVLGVMKAGAAYVPLDTDYPTERVAFILEDTDLPVLLTEERLLEHLPSSAHARGILRLDADWRMIAEESAENPSTDVTPQSLAYVIYTSGSTGRPKGVTVPHGALANHAAAVAEIFPIEPAVRLLQFITLSFDAAAEEIFPTLLTGGTLVLISAPTELIGWQLAGFCEQESINILHLPASVWHQCVDDLVPRNRPVRAPLEVLLVGGESPDVDRLRAWRDLTDGPFKFLNAYGPTEATITTTIFETTGEEEEISRLSKVPIGRPIANSQAFLLDTHLQPVPVGVPGELHIGGAGVARGYLNRPEVTAEQFVPHPFASEPGRRLYKTGDLARFRPDGSIEFLGRIDYQIKIRGFRVELEEIETVLNQHPAVQTTVVLPQESDVSDDVAGETYLAAYVVPAEAVEPEVSELRDHAKAKLPPYMVPSAFVILDALPLAPSGKVDRRALPTPDRTRDGLAHDYIAPRTALEWFLAERWQRVLGVDRIGIHDDFFELGGNSLQAAVVINRLQDELQETTHVRALFVAPTIAELAMYMIEYYPDAVAKIDDRASFDGVTLAIEKGIIKPDEDEQVDAAAVAQMRQLVTPLPPRKGTDDVDSAKNPPASFVLAPPRSGSTLLRVMLAGHPRLFAPPELALLSFNTIQERKASLVGDRSLWEQGLIRAVAEAKDCDPEEAQRVIESCENDGLTTKAFYGRLQGWIGDRTLVDKTPFYALDPETLKRMEVDFEGARYIHLVRHPYATTYSIAETEMDRWFLEEVPFSKRMFGELMWIVCHQNILDFLGIVPSARQHRVKFEDLVTEPEAVMRGICQFMDIAFHPALVHPYEGERMTDGLEADGQMVGDFKFYLRKEIDPRAAERWKKFHTVDFLSDIGWEVADVLGYERAAETAAEQSALSQDREVWGDLRPIPRDEAPPLSFSQQRLWFLEQLGPGTALYNVPSAMRLSGPLDVSALWRSLNEIVQRHEALRTTFVEVEGRPAQVIAPRLTLSLPVIDLQGLPESGREAEATRLATAEAQRPFDLTEGPLLRAMLLRLDQEIHIALLTMHHIVADGWSVGLLIREVAALYEAFLAGRPSPLPDLRIQYADFAHWQRQWLKDEVLQRELAYWEHQLGDGDHVLDLPTDRPRPPVQSVNGANRRFELSTSLSEALRDLSQRTGATLFMTLLAAFQTLLYRYTGQEEICVGTPIANRNHPEIESLIGFFVNTLVLRTDLSGEPNFQELLAHVREVALEAYAHQELPFEMLVEKLQPERDMSRAPLFQVMFTLQDAPFEPLELPGVTISPLGRNTETAKFDLTLSMEQGPERLRGYLNYNTDLFDAETIERMLGHYETLLEGIVADPHGAISTLPLLTENESQQLLQGWNQTAVESRWYLGIPWLFEARVDRNPDAVALVLDDQSLTYAELNRRANQVAHHLRRRAVGPEVIVGLLLERSIEAIVAMLGVLKVGGAYLPLDPSNPDERLSFILEDSGAPVLLTQAHLADQLQTAHNIQQICLDTEWEVMAGESDRNPVNEATAGNLAYVIYTSGSTGKPKGVLISNEAIANHCRDIQEHFRLTPEDRVLQFAAYSFDQSVEQILATFITGATLVLRGPGVWPANEFPEVVADYQLTVVNLPPAYWHQWVQESFAVDEPLSGDQLRLVISGGDVMQVETLNLWGKTPMSAASLLNAYGPTETTVTALTFDIPPGFDGNKIPIGRPPINRRIYILDRDGNPVPAGVPGELYLSGTGLARGYLDRPEITAEVFVPDPFSEEPGRRLYRTGDLVRYLPDGNVDFLGRVDQQVKIRGFRIELGEIEAALARHPTVQELAVMVREDTPRDKRLVAYLVADEERAPTASEWRSFLKEQLPDYMVPSAFVLLDALPLTTSGKINRRALPVPDQVRPELEESYVAPRTAVEDDLAEMWAEVLNLERVGIHDNFFDLGGHSLLATQLISRVRATYQVELPLRRLFEMPSVAGMATLIEDSLVEAAEELELAQLLAELEELSEDAALELLSEGVQSS
jgi:amino acid adenylation domain-containing protein